MDMELARHGTGQDSKLATRVEWVLQCMAIYELLPKLTAAILSRKRASGKIAGELESAGMNVISFKTARDRLRPAQPVRPPSVLVSPIPDAARATPDEHAEDRARMRQNLAAILAVVCIVVLGTWLIDGLLNYSRALMCLEAGHRHCVAGDHKFRMQH